MQATSKAREQDGGKRKHELDVEEEVDPDLPPGDIIEHEAEDGEAQGGHKRKRRRKTHNITAEDG